MRKIITISLALLALTTFANGRNDREVVLHQSGGGNCNELVYLDPPQVTYNEGLNELTVYFGSSGTIDLECVDEIGPYYYIYGEYHYGYTSTNGCVFQSGAKVKIEAGNVEIAKSFIAERGSKVELTKYIY